MLTNNDVLEHVKRKQGRGECDEAYLFDRYLTTEKEKTTNMSYLSNGELRKRHGKR